MPASRPAWHAYYAIFGVPSFRSQLLWWRLERLLGARPLSSALDAGCGGGALTVELASAHPSARFTGIDINGSSIEKAKTLAAEAKVTNVEWMVSSILAFKQSGFDLVLSIGALEFAKDPRETVSHLAGRASDGGLLVVTMPHAVRPRSVNGRGRASAEELAGWMAAAGCPSPRILKLARGPAFWAYRGSQMAQSAAGLAALHHLISLPLIPLDEMLPGRGDLLLGYGRVRRSP